MVTHGTSVSVVVPSYNYSRFLKDCVLSVLAQKDIDLRLLILDDASTDNSVAIASKLAASDARVELRVHHGNQGPIETYNEGVAWASGTYTVILDSDDILTPNSLRRSCDLLDAHPEVGIVYGRVRRFRGDRPPHPDRTAQPTVQIHPGHEWFRGRCGLTENCVLQPSVVMRTSVLKSIGGFHRELVHTADMEMWLRFSLYSDVGYIGGIYQAFYRVHSAGLHLSRFGTVLADLDQVASAFEILFKENRQLICNADQLEESVRKMLARRALDAACRMYDTGHPNSNEIAGLEQLARTTYKEAQGLAEWKRLRWRHRIGPSACLALRPFLLFTIASRFFRKVKRYRLHRMGLL